MGFCPYLRHAHTSDDEPSAGTWQTTFFTWFFLQLHSTALATRKKNLSFSWRNEESLPFPSKERKHSVCSLPSLGSWHGGAGHLPPPRLRPCRRSRSWSRGRRSCHLRRCHRHWLRMLGCRWRRRCWQSRRRHGRLRRGQQGPEDLVAVLPAASTKIREAPTGICLLLVGRFECSGRPLLRRQRRERVEGVVDLRGEAAPAGQAHDGAQIPVVEAAVLLHFGSANRRRDAEWLGFWRRRDREEEKQIRGRR
jgi:hypothetical protein